MRALLLLLVLSTDFSTLFNDGLRAFKAGDYTAAQPLLARAVAAKPDDFNARYLLGAVYSKTSRTDDALVAWRAALHLEPHNMRLMEIMAVEYTKGRYFGEAADLAQTLLQLKPDDPNVHFLAIKSAQDAGRMDIAAGLAHHAATQFPDSARANFEHAYHLQLQGKIGEALTYLRRAIALDPTYEEPPFFYGNLLVDEGHDADAVPYLRQAIKNRNDYVPARVVLARALMNQKLLQDAVAELDATVALDPTHPQPHLLLSQIYFRLGDTQRAAEEKRISLRLRREHPAVLEAIQSRPFTAR